jgi:propionyl-CoA carboxylase alpha chain
MTIAETLPAILVANRGEIALRIMRTLRRLGIRAIAVYHALDRNAPHVAFADAAVELKGDPPVAAYLDIPQLVAAAKASGAAAVHPGYGFLSENAAFPRALTEAGIGWIGPHAEAIAAMGDKIAAKRLAVQAGVSVVPGSAGAVAHATDAEAAAEAVGYPVMLKASAGGGGKGLRIVRDPAELAPAFAAAQAEAEASFGDGRIFVEKFIERPRHIEIQIAADRHGHVIHLGERECSLQRRNQKILEEAPSPFITPETRAAMGAEAVALAGAVSYDSLGTIEFIVGADRSFYFIEMNTRLQVEHPVTEAITGYDLVELQLRAAAGEPLGIRQDDVRFNGAAIELRICAEDPDAGFMPSTGPVLRLNMPDPTHARFDSGIAAGAVVTAAFDPLLAKLIVKGATRDEAIARAVEAASETCILGVTTNLPYLRRLLNLPAFRAGETHTGLLADAAAELAKPELSETDRAAMLAAVAARADTIRHALARLPEPLSAIGQWRNT